MSADLLPCNDPSCRRLPVWFAPDGERGRYQCEHPSGDWRVTQGPVPEPEARATWNRIFGAKP